MFWANGKTKIAPTLPFESHSQKSIYYSTWTGELGHVWENNIWYNICVTGPKRVGHCFALNLYIFCKKNDNRSFVVSSCGELWIRKFGLLVVVGRVVNLWVASGMNKDLMFSSWRRHRERRKSERVIDKSYLLDFGFLFFLVNCKFHT